MGDDLLKAPASQSFPHKAADISFGEGFASSKEEEILLEVPSNAINIQRIEEDDPSANKDHVQMQAEADQSDDIGLNGKVLSYHNNEKTEEKIVDANSSHGCSPSLRNFEEGEHGSVITPKETTNVLPLQSTSSMSETPLKAINDDQSIHLTSNSQDVSNELKVEIKNANWDESYLSSKVLVDSEKTEKVSMEEERDGLGRESESTGSITGSTSPCTLSGIPKCSLSRDISQPHLFLPVSDSTQEHSQAMNKLAGDLEILPPSRKGEVNVCSQNELDKFCDPSNQEWSDLEFGESTLISNDLEGWQRFDNEVVAAQGAEPRWEQLLDVGLDTKKHDVINPLQLPVLPAYKENHSEMVSPGNPFIEGHERLSGFSEADGFNCSKSLPPTDRFSQIYGIRTSLPSKEELTDEIARCDPSSGVTSTEGRENAVESSTRNQRKTTFSSLDMEPFEAPSFMSLVDPKSQAIFEALMPTYQTKHSGYEHERGEEPWVASFDLVAPSTQEITRSTSMPRSGSDTSGQRPGQSVSFTVNREEGPSKKENQSPSAHRSISGFLSPKVSPLVQKVVDKVRSTPAAANGVLNSVRQAMSPKASGKKSTSGSLLTRCICW
ncbi:hypothetical protein L7F22_038047 [Adiantum nelumboides]|nr:hypothetical protein [Adiantum nelumboides]